MTELASGTASAGLCDEVITLFRADGLEKITAGGGDDSEDITVHEIPVNQVEQWLKQQTAQNKLADLKVYSALYFVG